MQNKLGLHGWRSRRLIRRVEVYVFMLEGMVDERAAETGTGVGGC